MVSAGNRIYLRVAEEKGADLFCIQGELAVDCFTQQN
jgi:hypothetical protein